LTSSRSEANSAAPNLSAIIKSLPFVSNFFNPTSSKSKSTTTEADSKGRSSTKPLTATNSGHSTTAPTTKTSTLVPESGAALPTSSAKQETSTARLAAPATLTAATKSAAAQVTAATLRTPTVTATGVSPIAAVLALPARIADVVLGLIGVTPPSASTPTPISPAPVVQLVFAAFREFENVAGLDSKPAVLPTNTETFTGSVTTPTPTVAELLDAATAEYVLGGTPAGLTPFTVNGAPVKYSNPLTGTSAQVWVTPQNQIVIAYSGTTGGTNLLFHPVIALTQTLYDGEAVLTHTNPPGLPDALRFAKTVETEAAQHGYTTDNIFVTGHSLGGWEAEYVAQNAGLGGIGFESLGLDTTVPGNGADSLFVNTSTYGDVASYSSDLPGDQPLAPPYVPGGGIYPHYGSIVMLGDPSAQTPLENGLALWGSGPVGDVIALVVGLGQLFEYHLPSVQAHSLDVDLTPGLLPGSGVDSGPVYTGFGDLTIPEFLEAASNDGILIQP
jgi:hypothetical protein